MGSEALRKWVDEYDGGPSGTERTILERMLPLIEACQAVVRWYHEDPDSEHAMVMLESALRDLGVPDE